MTAARRPAARRGGRVARARATGRPGSCWPSARSRSPWSAGWRCRRASTAGSLGPGLVTRARAARRGRLGGDDGRAGPARRRAARTPGFTADGLRRGADRPGRAAGHVAGRSSAAGSAAIVLAVTLALGAAVPVHRLALRRAAHPAAADAAPMSSSRASTPSPAGWCSTAPRARTSHIAALYLGLGVVATGCLPGARHDPGHRRADRSRRSASLLLLLHARELFGVRARLAVFVPGVAGLAVRRRST